MLVQVSVHDEVWVDPTEVVAIEGGFDGGMSTVTLRNGTRINVAVSVADAVRALLPFTERDGRVVDG